MNYYRKGTSSDKFINYHSYHNMHVKLNKIKEMKLRKAKICHELLRQDGLKRFFRIFRKNSYTSASKIFFKVII